MRAPAIPRSAAPIDIGAAIPTLVMVGAGINALVVRAMEGVGDGALALSLGISPFQFVALAVAARLSLGDGASRRLPGAILLDAATLLLVLVPSSAVSWLALAFYAAVHAATDTGQRRQGALLFLAVALSALWSSVLLKWLAAPVTTAEAFMVGKLVGLVRPDIVQTANVVGNPDTHSLILMTRCTTADALPAALVSLLAVALLLGRLDPGRAVRGGVLLAAGLLVANLFRLAVMAWSADAYALAHGPVGANLFDGLQAVAVLALGSWVARS